MPTPGRQIQDRTDSAIDPGWEPPASGPTKRPRGWLPLLVVGLVTTLVAAGLFVADYGGGDGAGTAAWAYLPDDGAVSYQVQTTSTGKRSTTSKVVTESARGPGSLMHAGLDFTLGVKVGGVVGFDRLDRMQFWRTTSTTIGSIGEPQQVRVYRVDQGVTLIADSDAVDADIYSPGLVELPADVADGASWSSDGTVGSRRYRSEFRAEAAEPGCLRVTGTVDESQRTGQPTRQEVVKLWCRGRGVVTEETVQGAIRTTRMPASTVGASVIQTTDEVWKWTNPATWRRRTFDLRSADPTLGPGMMTGAAGNVPAVVTGSGLLIRVTNSDDLVATTPKTVDTWTTLWRMHPGGTVLTMAGFGNVVVATTSHREAVGYSDTGVRLWSLPLDDVAFNPAVRVDDQRIAIGDAGGGVRVIDALTGTEAWQARVAGQISAPLVADHRVVVALDSAGSTTAFAADDGEQLWAKDVSGVLSAVFGELVVVRHEATLEALDLTTGRHRWLLSEPGTQDALQPFGDVLLAASRLGTLAIDQRGTIQQRLPAYAAVTVVDGRMIGWGATKAEFRRPDLSLEATIDTSDQTFTSRTAVGVPYRHGVIVIGRKWDFMTWSSEP